ncbi:MAG: glycosyltransferase family 9 protein [Endomicrobiaceae bacterium]|nr:glycosyltransferase family 9 protein [Endomicrobiaceae bacterium]MDD3923061.1 glycosyltransferase family 9 protein [Endomicrobiaceae bacterium]
MKILIIKPSSFGDIIQANPVLQAIKTEWEDAQIDWLVFKQWKQVVELFPNVSNIKCWDRKGGIKAFFNILNECNKENYDIVIDLQGLLRTAVFTRLLNSKQKIGVSGMKECSWLILKEPYKRDLKLNAVLRNLKSLTYITGKQYNVEFKIKVKDDIPDNTDTLFLQYNIQNSDKIIAFIPFARGKTKNWNKENYLKLAEMIKTNDKDCKIVILGSQNDYGKIQTEQLIDLCGKTDILMLANILQKCKYVVGSDTGAMHLANAIGLHSAFIFGGSDINETSPYGNNAIVITANLSCSPCRGKCKYNIEKCLEQVTPEIVFERVKQWIK